MYTHDANIISCMSFLIHLVILPAQNIHIKNQKSKTFKAYIYFYIYVHSLLRFHLPKSKGNIKL